MYSLNTTPRLECIIFRSNLKHTSWHRFLPFFLQLFPYPPWRKISLWPLVWRLSASTTPRSPATSPCVLARSSDALQSDNARTAVPAPPVPPYYPLLPLLPPVPPITPLFPQVPMLPLLPPLHPYIRLTPMPHSPHIYAHPSSRLQTL